MDSGNTLFDCLVAWVNTFNLGVKCENSNDFKDGIVIAKCLNNIDPEYFNDEWLSKIKTDTNENWRLKLLNLKKILQTLTDYYAEVLNYSLNGFEMPNLNLIVESNSSTNTLNTEAKDELSHFLQLILGCAVNCERKSDFIKNIMEMNESTQHMIMTAIQELMSKDRNMNVIKSTSSISLGVSNDDDLNYQLKRAIMEINRVNEQKEDIEQKCKRLDKQVSELQDEKMALLTEMEMLKTKLQKEDNARTDPNNELNKQLRLQQKLDIMQEELYKLESEKEKYRIQFEAAKAEQDILIEKNIELKKMALEHQNLKDEIDILKHTSDKVEKLESTIETYKIKLEEMADLKKQMKALEENNTKYLEKILLMEEEVKKINTLKSQIDMYKKQIQELHEQILNDEMKMKKLEYEYKGVEETCSAVRSEKERIQLEYERLKESYEQLNINARVFESAKQNLEDENPSNQTMDGLFSSVELVNIPTEIKEKIIRLYHENKLLKSKQNDLNDERLVLIQNQYDDEKQRNLELQQKLNETSKQKIEIECQLNDLKKKDTAAVNSINNSNNQSNTSNGDKPRDDLINDLKIKLTRSQSMLDDEYKKNESIIKQLEQKIENLAKEKNDLKEIKDREIQAKEIEIAEINEKYRSYLEKAKIVIKTLDPNKSSNNEMQFFKTQLAEKDKIIKQLTKDNERLRNSREQEDELIASAWYQLGANLNRRSTDERIATIGNSFLSQQRLVPSTSSPATMSLFNQSTNRRGPNHASNNNSHLNVSNHHPASNNSFKIINPTGSANSQSNPTQTAAASS